MRGFIYITSNPSYRDGIIKIGKSAQDPEGQRVSTLRSTGVPSAFKVEYYAFVKEYDSVERQIHHRFASKRVENDREFFTCSVPEAIMAIREVAEIAFEKIHYKSEEEIAAIEAEKTAKALEKEKKRQEEEEQKRLKIDRAIQNLFLWFLIVICLILWIPISQDLELELGWIILGCIVIGAIRMMFSNKGRKLLLFLGFVFTLVALANFFWFLFKFA